MFIYSVPRTMLKLLRMPGLGSFHASAIEVYMENAFDLLADRKVLAMGSRQRHIGNANVVTHRALVTHTGAEVRAGGLRVAGLRKSYRNRPVIRDVSVTLDRGEVVALLGPNGSGKTTCFYCIAGLVAPDAGQVMIDGRDATAGALTPALPLRGLTAQRVC